MNFLNLPDGRQKSKFAIIFMENDALTFNKITILVPSDKKIKHLVSFLQNMKNTPFQTFFLTNKIKEKPQFTEEKDLRELREQCKKDREDNYVLLCYEEIRSKEQKALTSLKNIRKEVQQPLPKQQKEEDDGGCYTM